MIRAGTAADVPRALEIWRAAVDATHGFLSAEDRTEIDRMVAQDFLPNAPLWLAVDGADRPLGILVMDGEMIDALFVDPAVHGRGIGTALVDHALTLAPNALVDASEQASNAVPFYQSRGFVRTGRSDHDPQGRPYPVIHFRHSGRVG